MAGKYPRRRSNSLNEETDSPTLPPIPGDNGTETHSTSISDSPPNNCPTSSVSTTTTSSHSIPNSSIPATELQSTPTNPNFNHINNINSSYAVTSPPYFTVTSPVTSPPISSNSFRPPSPGQSLDRNRQSLVSSNHQGRRNDSHLPITPHVDPAPAPAMYWSKIKTYGKSPRALRAHTVNLVGELMFVFGGCDAKTCYNSVFIFDADTMYWNKARTIGEPPSSCRAHSSTLVDKKLFIFGGGDGPTYFNDLYIFDTDTLTWSKPQTTGDIPSPRRAHTSAYYNNNLYIFGGGDGVRALNDVYTLDITDLNNLSWKKLESKGTPPISRGYHTSNLVGSKLVVYGGSDGHECFGDVYMLDLDENTWIPVSVETSCPRLSHTATQVGSYLFVVCGHDGTRYTAEVLLLNLVTMEWESRRVYGTPPSGRGYHTTVLYDSRLFVFGGYDGHSVFDDIFVLDLSACAYLPQITNFQLPDYKKQKV
ncbi:2570_t:CDS:2 [Funneliformis caledonium]|uniref:2570_t:CDS:1 n=2 Tax=Funneliformis TaxID=1117308 RepID=A0A9N8VEC9_9GLOM|nr:2570_t:CDS:2 [Funneliformis caledonium]